jgi:hypothetical protein
MWPNRSATCPSHEVAPKFSCSYGVPLIDVFMKIILRFTAVLAFGAATAGCTTVALAPGAERVRVTTNAAEVASCKGVGSVKALSGSAFDGEATIRNQALGLGANTIFVTRYVSGSEEGVAYNCP